MSDHPSGQPEIDIPTMLQRLERNPASLLPKTHWDCAVCLNMVAGDPEGSAHPAVTVANGTTVCAAHVEQAFSLGEQVRSQRKMRQEQSMARLRGMLGSP